MLCETGRLISAWERWPCGLLRSPASFSSLSVLARLLWLSGPDEGEQATWPRSSGLASRPAMESATKEGGSRQARLHERRRNGRRHFEQPPIRGGDSAQMTLLELR